MFLFLQGRQGCFRTRCDLWCVSRIRARSELRPRPRVSPAVPGALTAPPDSRETMRFTSPVFREETITAPLPCCECMQTDVSYTHLCCARREGLQDRMTHAHSDCVLNERRKTDRLIYTSRFVHVIYSSRIVLIKPGTVTPLRRGGLRAHVR